MADKNATRAGIGFWGFGSALAITISWSLHESVGWAMPICTANTAVDPVDTDLGQGGDIPASGQIRIRPSFPCRSVALLGAKAAIARIQRKNLYSLRFLSGHAGYAHDSTHARPPPSAGGRCHRGCVRAERVTPTRSSSAPTKAATGPSVP